MDFFEHQDNARRKTLHLVVLFLAGVLLTVALVNLIGYGVFYGLHLSMGPAGDRSFGAWLDSNYSWQVSLATVLVILAGSLSAYIQLRKGGEVVARWAGATPIDYDTRDPDQRRFINAVEEMSIASGTPVPSLYLMPRESSINAFVAGYQSDQAVLVVSRGALETLDRDELQGVIGHEYSHILNGDMRLNIRLMAVLAGLVQIGQLGRWMVESAFYHSSGSRRRGRFSIPLVGLGLMLVGYVGVLTGRMIKSAVSRQREFLADASSIQFTRNPEGIAGALYKIREHHQGSRLTHRHAEDMSHFCFGESVNLSSMLATHPPLDERIRRVHPTYLTRARHREQKSEDADTAVSRTRPEAFEQVMGAAALSALAGRVTPDHLDYARELYRHIPEQVRNSVHQSAGARAFCYSQVLLANDGQRQAILDQLKTEDAEAIRVLQPLWSFYRKLDPQLRLPILDLAVPVLKRLGERERLVFLDRIDRLVRTDGRTVVREWVLAAQLHHHLRQDGARRPGATRPFRQAGPALAVLLSALVHCNREPRLARAAFDQVMAPFEVRDKRLREPDEAGFDAVGEALETLGEVAYFWRGAVIQACVDMVQSDGVVHQDEYELVRTIADSLGCPMPPLAEHEWSPAGGVAAVS